MKSKIEPLVWSEAKPLHPGYYWLKYKQGEAAPKVVHVVANPHGKLWADIGGRWDNTMIDSRMFNGGLWAGPIPLPDEPPMVMRGAISIRNNLDADRRRNPPTCSIYDD